MFRDTEPVGLGAVRVKRDELLKHLEENRTKHRTIFEEAQEGFRTEVIRLLDERLAAAKSGKGIDLRILLPEPQDHTKDYDRVILMVKMSVEDEQELTHAEFQQYVMDDWSWKREFVATASNYTSSIA